jgi:hypothetical protein
MDCLVSLRKKVTRLRARISPQAHAVSVDLPRFFAVFYDNSCRIAKE